ncbi:hypothetical protein Tco_0963988 [Tanacetum coccineum]
MTFVETPPPSKTSPLVDDDLDEEEAIKVTENKNLEKYIEDETLEIDEIVNIEESRNHPLENIIGNFNQRTLRLQAQNQRCVRLDNQSIKRDRLIGIGFVLNLVKFISFTFGDKEMISVIEAVSR